MISRKHESISNFSQALCQDYEVNGIECSFGEVSVENNRRINQKLYAILTKPDDFLGDPIFADDRGINPLTDKICSIKPVANEKSKNEYELYITDLEKCGVLVKNVSFGPQATNFGSVR